MNKIDDQELKALQKMDIFGQLAHFKQLKQEEKRKREGSQPKASNAGVQTNQNSKIKQQVQSQINYHHRKARGQLRITYNDGVSKIPGHYNPDAEVKFEKVHYPSPHFRVNQEQAYELYNLTSNARTNSL
mmetsp:Transcript_8238/g.13798  ORF Transcript_8238/g.13798 Transcript_8238/m.13798 type:complete len:130 (+) Transcript_8238:330-719(+)